MLAMAGAVFAQTTPTTTSTTTMPLVLNVNAAGKVLLRGTVVSVSSGSLTLKSYGGEWTINVPASAQVLPQGIALSSFAQGDFVGVQGTINSGSNWTVDAILVRDWTQRAALNAQAQANVQTIKSDLQSGPHNTAGTVSNVSGTSFTLTSSAGTAYSVSLNTGAIIVDKSYHTIDMSQVHSGDSVRVWGTTAGSAITASVFRDLSIPRQ